MKTGKSILRIISIVLCAILLAGSVPAASSAEVVKRASDAATVIEKGQAAGEVISQEASNAGEIAAQDRAGADQVQNLAQMRAGEDDDEKKPSYYWTTFYLVGSAVLIMVLVSGI
ncbi:MAG: hypothetical protein HZB23_11495 [Deltaproteobacteria bacterium]|nr:hypothetical protein [Deltaproteobacteria bacterium]